MSKQKYNSKYRIGLSVLILLKTVKRIDSLSKGNQQKIQLLASMLHKPELLILDEPSVV